MWALFKNNKQISKSYPHKLQAIMHAFEKGFVGCCRYRYHLMSEIQIKQVGA